MCNLDTEGLQYACGHYVITKKIRKIDCQKPTCKWSEMHVVPCPARDCRFHEQYLGPDNSEKIVGVVKDFCDKCRPYWTEINGDPTRFASDKDKDNKRRRR